jgi:hypothetical protein
LEGRGSECPNLLPDKEIGETAQVQVGLVGGEVAGLPEPEFLPLHSGVPLDMIEAREIARRGRAVVLVLVGMHECGKTSLIARLHQLFQGGPIGDLSFAGSRTLLRFEELNWKATVESGQAAPGMERTSAQFDNSFLHLRVRDETERKRIDLLINDVSGETFRQAVATQAVCESLLALRRADHLAVLLDCSAIAKATLRHAHVAKARDFVQRVVQHGQVGMHTALHLVFSKWDELKGAVAVVDKVEEEFQKAFSNKVGSLNQWRIAARPTDSSLPTADVIGQLFSTWVKTSHQYPDSVLPPDSRYSYARDFCRFGL